MVKFGFAATALVIALALGAEDVLAGWMPWVAEGKPVYTVEQATTTPSLSGYWDGGAWKGVPELTLDHFLGQNDEGRPAERYRPDVRVKVLHDERALYVFFRVDERYVRSIANTYRGKVWEDACAEFFVQPKPERGYFNFEINCGGTMLLSYHEHPAWKGETQAKAGAVPWELARHVAIYHSMPPLVNPEIDEKTVWLLEYRIPLDLLEAYVGPLGSLAGQEWRANFYKCAETNSHPNWATWSPILEGDSFHAPRYFGLLRFQ